MPLAGLIGYPLGHTFSPAYFSRRFAELGLKDWAYQAFPLPHIEWLYALLEQHDDLRAFNVTIPHKETVLTYCGEIDTEAAAVGAANLVCVLRKNGELHLKAFNTDVYGFRKSLETWYRPDGKKALILGSGGSSRAVAFVLKALDMPFDTAGRSQALTYKDVQLNNYGLLINCTPAGMQHNASEAAGIPESLALDFTQAGSQHQYYDLVYNPSETVMMQRFASAGASVKNGLEMLHLQAEKSLELLLNHCV